MNMNGVIIPPRPYIKRFLDKSLLAGNSLYLTPLSANGTSAIQIHYI